MDAGWRNNDNDAVAMRRFVRRNLSRSVVVVAASLAIGVVYMLIATPRFAATATMVLDPAAVQSRSAQIVFLELDTHVKLIDSDLIAKRVVSENDLLDRPEFIPEDGLADRLFSYARDRISRPLLGDVRHLDDLLAEQEESPETPDDLLMRRVVSKMQGDLKVRRLGDTRLVTISFTSDSPTIAAEVPNAFARSYEAYLGDGVPEQSDCEGADHSPPAISLGAAAIGAGNLIASRVQIEGDLIPVDVDCEETGSSALRPTTVLSLASPAMVPYKPAWPNPLAILALFGALGVAAAGGLAARAEWTSRL